MYRCEGVLRTMQRSNPTVSRVGRMSSRWCNEPRSRPTAFDSLYPERIRTLLPSGRRRRSAVALTHVPADLDAPDDCLQLLRQPVAARFLFGLLAILHLGNLASWACCLQTCSRTVISGTHSKQQASSNATNASSTWSAGVVHAPHGTSGSRGRRAETASLPLLSSDVSNGRLR
jgi:hypothetical protein